MRSYTAADLARARQRAERAAQLVIEQQNRVVWMTARGRDTAEGARLLAIMLQLLDQREKQRDAIAAALGDGGKR
jgi:hypothetical protein